MKPLEELVELTKDEIAYAPLLSVYPEFIRQWRRRERLLDGAITIESGYEPSQGFIASALAILRNKSHV